MAAAISGSAVYTSTSFTSQNENAHRATLPNGNSTTRFEDQAEQTHQRNLNEMQLAQENENVQSHRTPLPNVNAQRFHETNEIADKYRTSQLFNRSPFESQNAAENAYSGNVVSDEQHSFQRPMSPATFAERFGKENRQPPVAMYQVLKPHAH